MSWSSLAVRKPLSSIQTQPRLLHKDIICIHTMVGYLTTTDAMFNVGGYTGTESHFGVGGQWGSDVAPRLDGALWQFQDTDYTADANFDGNWHVISIEVADNAPQLPSEILPMTPAQVDTIVALICELCVEYGIPPVLVPDTLPTRRGLAYHYQGVPPNLVKGGEVWSAAGHVCPGPARIEQFKTEIIPRVQAQLKGDTDVNWDDKVALTADDAKVWGVKTAATPTSPAVLYKAGDMVSYSQMVRYPTLARKIAAQVSTLSALVVANEAKDAARDAANQAVLNALAAGGPITAAQVQAAAQAGAEAVIRELSALLPPVQPAD